MAVKAFTLDQTPDRTLALADALRRLAAGPAPAPAAMPVFDAGLHATTPFLVMDYESAETLDLVMRYEPPASLERALAVLAPVAELADAAWAAGFGHGTIAPAGIFLTPGGRRIRVSGWGVARALEAAGVAVPFDGPYGAPEQGTGRWGLAADVHALGAVALELLARHAAAPGRVPAAEWAPGMSRGERERVVAVLDRALAEDPAGRPESCAALIAALRAAGQPSTAIARPVSAGSTLVPAQQPRSAAAFATFDESEDDEATEASDSGELPLRVAAYEAAPLPVVPAERRTAWLVLALVAAVGIGLGGGMAYWLLSQQPMPGAVDARQQADILRTIRAEGAQPPPGETAAQGAAPVEPSTTPEDASRPVADALPGGANDAEAAALPTVDAAVPPGYVVVRSRPSGALVTIDGRFVGNTPVTARELGPGSYRVQVARPGYVPQVVPVTISADEPVRTLTVSLEPGVGTEAAGAASGAIAVDSRPRGARVLVDGRFVGLAPLRVSQVRPGSHDVTLELVGYRSATSRVQVPAGRVATVRMGLTGAGR